MQDLNEDLDDQFRKAVDHYRVRPPESKWDELSGKIVSIKRPRSLADTIRSKYLKWFTLLGLVILIPVVIVSIVPGINGYQGIKTGAADIVVQKNKTEIIYRKSKKEQELVSQVHEAFVKQNKTEPIGGAVSLSGEPDKIASTVNAIPFVKEPNETSGNGITISARNKLNETAIPGNSVPDKNELNIPENRSNDLKSIGSSSAVYSEQDLNNKPIDLASPYGLTLTQAYPKNIEFPFSKNEVSPLALNSGNHENLPLQHLDYSHRQGIYLGLAAGPMLTQVGDQGLKKSGFDFGLIGGYTINKKFSIETGVIYTNQYFFVSGKYYNKFAGIDNATALDGSRTAFEIPLTLKYNILRKKGGNFFVAAGASTYLGVNDKVLIKVEDGALPPSLRFDYGVSSFLPSYVNFSLGYEYKIGRFANIRIEPYVQIPLNYSTGNSFKTLNTGPSIQFFNSGIHIGITRFIR